jgi:hypothetical protein
VSNVANLIESTNALQNQISNISSLSPQMTYSFITRDTFYALVPAEFKQYYLFNVRMMANWYQGFVPEFHKASNGIFSTRIGNSIIKEVTKLIVGGNVFFGNKYKESNPAGAVNKTLQNWNNYSDRYKFQTFVKRLVEYTAALGTAVVKLNINENSELVPTVWRLDQCFYQTDFGGYCTSFTGFLKSYTASVDNGQGRAQDKFNYYLLENRYYRESDGKAVTKICIKRSSSSVIAAQSFDITQTSEVAWEQLPKQIRNNIKKDYGNKIRLDEEVPISKDLPNLGIIISRYTAVNTIPEVDMGESALANIVTYLISYEQAFAEMITDLYIARGKVLLPQQMSNPTDKNNIFYSDLDGLLFTRYPYLNEKDQKPIAIQFELRAAEWVQTRNNIVENIASSLGVAGSDLFSFLRDATGSSKTATQVASEAQKTISYIMEKRALFTETINEFIQIWKKFYNVTDDFGIKFSSQNHVNMLVTTEQTRVMHEVGFGSFDVFKHFFPDLDDEQIQEMVLRKEQEEKRKLQIQAEINIQAFENSLKLREETPKTDKTPTSPDESPDLKASKAE